LFATACCRQVWHELGEEDWRNIAAAEDVADGAPWPEGLPDLWSKGLERPNAEWVARFVAEWLVAGNTEELDLTKPWQRSHARNAAHLLRDIFGNPFRPIAFPASWRTDTALALARQMYESRDFSALPILADALQDAGCDSAEVLDHCRGPGPHVRGCWCVDLVLGKE
jgi:hypothetical protein